MSRTTGRARTESRPATGSRSRGVRSQRSSSKPRRVRDVRSHLSQGLSPACRSRRCAPHGAGPPPGGHGARRLGGDASEDDRLLELAPVYRPEQEEAAPFAPPVPEGAPGDDRALHRGHQRQRLLLREDRGPVVAGSVGRARPDRDDRLIRSPAADDPARLGREVGQVGDAALQGSHPVAAASCVGPAPRLQPSLAVRHDGHRLRPEEGRLRDRLGRQALHRPEAEGQGDGPHENADTMGLVMLANGDDPAHVTQKTWDAAVNRIKKAVSSGQIRQFTGNDYAPLLAKGDVWACFAWSGDMVQLQADHPGLRWNPPKTGAMIWTDNMLIPKGGNVYAASVLADWFYIPKIAAEVEDYVNYICPVSGADKVLEKSDPAVAKDPLIFPPASLLRKTHQFDSNALNNIKYKQDFQHLPGA